jgi:hypothetical protein
MASAWTDNLSMDWLPAGRQENQSHAHTRNSGGVCGQGLSMGGGHSIAPAVQPDCGPTQKRTQWEWMLYTGLYRWYRNPHEWKIPKHFLRASTGGSAYSTTVVSHNSVVYQSTRDGDSTIYKEERFKGPKEPTLSWHTLQLTNDVKYLGLTLDSGLMWKEQLKNGLQGFLDL